MLSENKKKILSDNSGFTMIELLASVFIIALISGVFMVNYHNTNKRSELGVEKQKLASNIRLAQNYSLGSKTYDGVTTPSGGWGVHFDKTNNHQTSYIIFADKAAAGFPNGNKTYDVGEAIETKVLPAGVTISALSPVDIFDIVFFPPDPTVYINSKGLGDVGSATASITLKESINNSTATVSVNFFGLIDTN